MTRSRWQGATALVVVLALGVLLGRAAQAPHTASAPLANDAQTLQRLDELNTKVSQLSAAYAASQSVASVARQPTTPAAREAAEAPAPRNPPEELANREAPTDAQIVAGDELVALADRILQSGRVTADDRRALREAAADADPERRDETMLALVRAANAQRLKPTEPGPMF